MASTKLDVHYDEETQTFVLARKTVTGKLGADKRDISPDILQLIFEKKLCEFVENSTKNKGVLELMDGRKLHFKIKR